MIFSKSAGHPTYTFKPRHLPPPAGGTATVVSQAAYDNELWLIKGVAHDGPEVTGEDPMTAVDMISQRNPSAAHQRDALDLKVPTRSTCDASPTSNTPRPTR